MSRTAAAPAPASAFDVRQDWASYTPDDHLAWATLYRRRLETLRETGSRVFLEGLELIGLREDRVPDLHDVNLRLAPRTGWRAVPVAGFVPAAEFFASLARRRFPTTVIVRPLDRLDYLPEPDIFHDVFGHVPLHANPTFATFLQRFGALAARARTPEQTEAMARLFWFTVEFGLVREDGAVKVYGSGLVSSAGDAANALGPHCDRRPFVLADVLAQPFEIDHFQDVLFVLDDFSQLFEALDEAAREVGLGGGE